jgi:hypothetical protein
MEYGEMGGAPAPFLVPYSEESRSAQRWDSLGVPSESAGNNGGPFAINSYLTGDPEMQLTAGEGYVDGWFATDENKKTPDLSSYQQEEITIVVGWDPDAVYSSDIHSNREEADAVIIQLERNTASDIPYIPTWRGVVEDDGSGGYEIPESNLVDLRPIGRPVETLPYDSGKGVFNGEESKGPGVNLLRGRPTAFTGGAATGPQEAPLNALRAQFAQAPANSEATQGDRSILTMLQSAGVPAAYMERIMDGQGGVYAQQLEAGVGDFPDVNTKLRWKNLDVSAFSDLNCWYTETPSGFTTTVTSPPNPRLEVSSDGSNSSDEYGGFYSDVVTAVENLKSFKLTFKDVAMSGEGYKFLGISTLDANDDPFNTGSSLGIRQDSVSETSSFHTGDGSGASHRVGTQNVDFSSGNRDITIEVRDDFFATYGNGEILWDEDDLGSDAPIGDAVSPFAVIEDDGSNSESGTISIGDIVVEPLPEVLN